MSNEWTYLIQRYGSEEGARKKFEDACIAIFRAANKQVDSPYVGSIKCNPGDGGVDIYTGEYGVEPITVVQCKFFVKALADAQKAQIRESFERAINSTAFKVKKWILCLPIELDNAGAKWWHDWKKKQLQKYAKDDSFIGLIDGQGLIAKAKEISCYDDIFDRQLIKKLNDIHRAVCPPPLQLDNLIRENILFSEYQPEVEPFYLSRDIDILFENSLNINNVWVHGASGSGKTALMMRNLLFNNIEYCDCSLNVVDIDGPESVLVAILESVETFFDVERDPKEKNLIKQIGKVILSCELDKPVIVIDELAIPQANEKLMKDVIGKLFLLASHYRSIAKNSYIRFIISTIATPYRMIENKAKAGEHFQFIATDIWQKDLKRLFDIICSALDLPLTEYESEILNGAKLSPGRLKNIIRKLIAIKIVNEATVKNALELTAMEHR